MKGYLEDLKAGGRPMTDKELADHYKHLYSELKKQKDDVVEYINKHCVNEKISKQVGYKCYTMADTNELEKIMRMLGEIE